MNLLYLHTNRQWGGGEVWLTQIVEALEQRGHHVLVASRRDSALSERLHPRFLHPLRISGDFNPVTVGRLVRLIRRRKIELLCAHTDKELRVGGIAAALTGVPIVISREVDVPLKDSRTNRLFYGRIASAIIVNSYSTKNTLLNSAPFLTGQNIHVVWKGLDPTEFQSAPPSPMRGQFGLGENDVLAGFLGRLDEQKGVMTLIEAAAIAAAHSDRFRLVIAGEGNLRKRIEAYIQERNLAGRVVLTGFRNNTREFLSAIDFLVVPSNWEGFGYSAVEAMAAGKPVVASSTSSLSEIVEDARTGILVPPRFPERLADAMLKLVRQPSLAREMGKAGLVRARNMFALAPAVNQVESIFHAILNHEPAPVPDQPVGTELPTLSPLPRRSGSPHP